MPRSFNAEMSRSAGRRMPVALVISEIIATRVRSVTLAITASNAASGPGMGHGRSAVTTFAPARAATARQLFTHAVYSLLVTKISAPARRSRLCSTVATPVVALCTNTRSRASHPTTGASASRERSIRPHRSST